MAKLAKTISETESSSESAIYRYRPDMSYPPQEISDVASEFWQPKATMAAAHAKPKSATSGKAAAEAKPATKSKQ
jgi:hypothetical protein